jgi:predicted  nucleic acid-binding Zn-ribbon protein
MGDGLKDQWGVSNPAQAGADKQSQQFQAAFQKEIGIVNDALQVSAPIAEDGPQQDLTQRHDSIVSSYQSTLAKVDPKDPTKAKSSIDKALADAQGLSADAVKFRKAVEKAYHDWQTRQPKYDDAVHQVEDLEAWGDPKAAPLRALVDGIRKLVNDRKYGQANTTFDQLSPKLKPIYDEYLKQKAAKDQYDPGLLALQPRIADASKCQFARLQATQADIAAIQEQMDTTAKAKDFVKALDMLGILSNKLDTFGQERQDLEQQKRDYQSGLTPLQPRLATARPAHVKLDPMSQDITAVQQQMEAAAQQEQFEQAQNIQKDLASKLDTYQTALTDLEKQKQAYDDALAKIKPKLDQINQCDNSSVTMLQEEIASTQGDMEQAAKQEEYEQALKLVETLGKALDSYDTAKTGQIYVITLNNKKYYGTMEELTALKLSVTKKAIESVLQPLKNRAECFTNWGKDLKNLAEDHYVISSIINALGGVSVGGMDAVVGAQKPALDALDAAISGDLKNAEAAYKKAVAAVNAAGAAIAKYMDGVESGGSRTITALQVVEVTCFAIGAAAGAAVLAPAGAGLAATAGANAVAGAGFGALQTLSEQGLAKLVWGDADKINPTELITNTIVSAVANGVGAALGAAASKALGGMVVEKIVAKFGFKQAASKLIVQDIVHGSLGNTVQTAVAGAPGLIRGKTTWDQFAVAVAEAFIAGGIGGAIVGKMNRNSPLFKGLKQEEIDKAFQEVESGTGVKMPAQDPKTGQGLTDTEQRFDPNAAIPAHDNTTLKNIKGAPPGWEVQVRRHSANANAPDGSYSRDNPTTQISAVEPAPPNETDAMRKARFGRQKYLLPDGNWKTMKEMTEAEKQAAHIH